MSDNKRIFKNSIILYIRLIITSGLGLWVSRLVIQNLGVADFGLYCVVGGIVTLIAFLNTVMVSTTYRYIAFEMGRDNANGINKIFNISLLIHICIAIFIFILAETVGRWYIYNKLNVDINKVHDAFYVFRMSILATLFFILSVPFQGLVTAKENFVVRASIEVVKSVLTLCCVLCLFFIEGDKLRVYAEFMALVGFVYSLLFFLYCRINYYSFVRWSFQNDRGKYKEMLRYSGWIMFGAAASVGQVQGSALIINVFFSTILNASFGIANQINTFLKMFSGNLGQAVVPQITKSYSGGNIERTEQLVCYTSKYCFFLLLIVGVPILLETDFILKMWLGVVPKYAVVFTRWMIYKALLDTMSAGISSAVQATGKIKWFQLILSSMMLISLPLSYILFYLGFPPYSILVVFLCVGVINTVLRLIMLKKIVHFNIVKLVRVSYLKILYVCLSIVPIFLLHTILEYGLSRFILSIILSIIIIILSIYFWGIDDIERNMVRKKLKI